MAGGEKPKFAMYWAAGCGGCEISVLNIGERILAVDEAFEIVFWPCAADFKRDDVAGYPDGWIDLCLFNGAICSTENEEMAHLLRRKAKLLVAFGSCAHEGGIPALANLTTREEVLRTAFLEGPSIDNPRSLLPELHCRVPEGELEIPALKSRVRTLDQVVPVDYAIPGCPPEPPQIWAVLDAVIRGAELPPPGGTRVIGAGHLAVCEECPLAKSEKAIERFYMPHEIVPEPGICLLEQGLVCMGVATRSGCGALCPKVNMPCRGCYGLLDEVEDQGANLVAAIGSVIGAGAAGQSDEELERRIEAVIDTLPDPAGTFYRYNLARSLLHRARVAGDGAAKGGAK